MWRLDAVTTAAVKVKSSVGTKEKVVLLRLSVVT